MRKMPQKQRINEDDNLNLTHHQKKLRYLRARRTLRRLEIMLARLRSVLKVVGIVFIAWAIIKLINSPQWYLSNVIFSNYPNNFLEIEGNEIVSNKQIMDRLKNIQLPNKPLYLLDVKPIEKSVLKLTPIKKVYIRRFWFPARLRVVVDEKKPILAISPSPEVAPIGVFTEDASIIGKDFLPLHYSGEIYKVLTYDDYSKWSSRHVKYLVYLSELIEGVTRKKVLYLDIRNPDDVYAQLDGIKLRLGELDRTVFVRAKRVGAMLTEALKIRDTIDYVDLRWNKSISIKLKNKEMPRTIKDEEKDPKLKSKSKPKAKKEPVKEDPVKPSTDQNITR